MIFSSPPQFGQCAMSISNTRLSSLAQLGLGYAGKLLKDSLPSMATPARW